MAENALIKVLLDEGTYLPLNAGGDCGVESGLGTILSRPVSILLFSKMIKSSAMQKISLLLDKTLATGTPLLMLFSDREKAEASFSCGEFLQKLIRLSGVCPVVALVSNETGTVASRLLPFADFVVYASGLHDRTSTAIQTLDLPAAVECVRTLLSLLPLNCAEQAPLLRAVKKQRKQSDAHNVLIRIADPQTLFETYLDSHTQICFARIGGRCTGLLQTEKGTLPRHAARFIQFCDCYSLPIIIATESTLALDEVQLFVLAQSTVPKLCIGDAGESGRMFDFLLASESAECCGADATTGMEEIRMSVLNALEYLSVKRDVLPPHKHGNMPV